jgi:hypothetical protein
MTFRKRGSTALPSRVPARQINDRPNVRSATDSGKSNEFNITTHHLFIDYKAAYGTITGNKIYVKKAELEFPTKLIHLTKATVTTVKCCVKIQNDLRISELHTRGTIFNKLFAYADDIDIVGRSLKALPSRSSKKTKYMNAAGDKTILNAGQTVVTRISNSSTNLWVWRYSEESTLQIDASAACENICGHLTWHVRQSKRSTRPVMLYGSERWVLAKRGENRLLVFEMKVLRTIYGPKIVVDTGADTISSSIGSSTAQKSSAS